MKATIKRHPLRKWRFMHGTSLLTLASHPKLDTSITTLSEIETGRRRPNGDLIRKLSAITGIPAGEFVNFKGAK